MSRELRDDLDADLPVIFISGERVDPFDRGAATSPAATTTSSSPSTPRSCSLGWSACSRDHAGRAPLKPAFELSEREVEILQLIAEGCPPGEVAQQLLIAPKEDDLARTTDLAKLGGDTRAQAVALAYAAGLIQVGVGNRDNELQEVEAHVIDLLAARAL